jgi:hypothetical protein
MKSSLDKRFFSIHYVHGAAESLLKGKKQLFSKIFIISTLALC